jgi:uncharacterized protein with von Willebrand factor type A (vWA) domain
MSGVFAYARWDGTQAPDPFSAEDLLDAIADQLLDGADLDAALRRLLEHGHGDLPGLRDLLAELEREHDEPLTDGGASEDEIAALMRQLREALGHGKGADVDAQLVQRVLGPASRRDLERLRGFLQTLEAAGYVRRRGETVELTPEGVRRIGRKALADVFAKIRPGRVGSHVAREPGPGGEGSDDTKPYEFGDAFRLELARTLLNAVRRGAATDAGAGVKLAAADFEVWRAEQRTRCATVLLIDTSRSMLLRGCVGAAKKVAIALDSLIRSAYPNDELRIVGFADRARELPREEMIAYDYNQQVYGTNLQHGLAVARELLSRQAATTRQIILVTDGEPTAHFERGQLRLAYPPTFQTLRATLREVGRCTRDRIMINTFMLERSRYLTEFVDQMTKINRGRAFYAEGDRLGEYVLVDYLANRRKRIA